MFAGRSVLSAMSSMGMHIESGMLTPAELARAVSSHGTTSMFVYPHEIAKVLGLEGVRLMHDEALLQPVNIYTQMPSCAPSAPGLETTGYEITPEDVAEAMTWPGIIGLGEMKTFDGVPHSGVENFAVQTVDTVMSLDTRTSPAPAMPAMRGVDSMNKSEAVQFNKRILVAVND